MIKIKCRPVAVTYRYNKLYKARLDVSLCYITKHPDCKEALWRVENVVIAEQYERDAMDLADQYAYQYNIPVIKNIKRGDIVTPEQLKFLESFITDIDNKNIIKECKNEI